MRILTKLMIILPIVIVNSDRYESSKINSTIDLIHLYILIIIHTYTYICIDKYSLRYVICNICT